MALSPPLRGRLTVTTPYGVTAALGGGVHTGVDFAARTGTPVYAANDGIARKFSQATGGRMVAIAGADGIETRYAHLSAQLVSNGQHVRAGQQIATSGASGLVTGPHLHFEVLAGGRFVDPMPYLSGATLAVAPRGSSATGAGADASAWVDKLRQSVNWARGATWAQFFENGDRVKPLGNIGNDAEYHGEGFTDASWSDLKAAVASLGLTDKPISEADYPAIAARMTTPTTGDNPLGGLLQLALPPLLEPGINIAVLLGAAYIGWQGVRRLVGAT